MKLNPTLLGAALVAPALFLLGCKGSDEGGGEGGNGGGSEGGNGGTAAGGDDRSGLTEVKLEWPEAEFQGTPVPLEDVPPNLEKPGQPKLSIWLPEGSKNVAAGKPVTCSIDPFLGEAEYVTDEESSGGDGFYLEMDPGLQWVQIDLGKEENIHGIIMWHYHRAARIYNDVVVAVGSDPEFKEGTFTTVYNNDHDESTKDAGFGNGPNKSYVETNHGRIIEIPKGIKGQYVRCYTNGNSDNSMNNFIEVQVWAKGE